MYSFGNRQDCGVVDEPLFGYFLKHTGLYRPSRQEVLAEMELDPDKVIHQLNSYDASPLYFMKHMANQLIDLDWSFIQAYWNVILTRHPEDMLTSYVKQIEHPSLLDTAYGIQVELVRYLEQHQGHVLVLDSKEVLLDPEMVLRELCAKLEIEFDDRMLSWERGKRPEDGVWAKYWYSVVHNSTGFAPYIQKNEKVPGHLESLLDECLTHYEYLSKYSIKAGVNG